MIKHLLKIIWAERKVNAWIVVELILAFTILWFSVDYLFFMAARSIEPRGFHTDHTYTIHVALKDEGRVAFLSGDSTARRQYQQDLQWIFDRIEQHPAIEALAMSTYASPYSESFMSQNYELDTLSVSSRTKFVTPGFFDVFRIHIAHGRPFTHEEALLGNVAVVSGDRDNMFNKIPLTNLTELQHNQQQLGITGVAARIKRSEFENYGRVVYRPFQPDKHLQPYVNISVRVKPQADKNFIGLFREEMREQLEIGQYFLSGITSMRDTRRDYISWNEFDSNLKSTYAITAFLLVNIFLGVVGTFWFRVHQRRSEIGLRMALGAARNRVKHLFMAESVLLLLLASVVATVISINISLSDLLVELGLPMARSQPGDLFQFVFNYSFTLLILALTGMLAVWYPAKQASRLQPADALRDE